MAKEPPIKFTGRVVEALPNAQFRVEIMMGEEKHSVLAYLNGKIRQMNTITITVGDEVDIEVSPYDYTKGRIVWRVTR